jgi:hypothetical protein
MSANPVNPYEFDAEFSIADSLPAAPAAQPAAQPTAQPAAQPTQGAPAAAAKFRREIDLGDGSGKQVFEADTPEELIDKLTKAQENATRKIRQLNRQVKATARKPQQPAAQPKQPRVLSADEQFQLATEIQTNPLAAFDKLFEATTGFKPDEFRAHMGEFEQIKAERDAQVAVQGFLNDHATDYFPTPRNYQAIQNFLDSNGLPLTSENLEYAFDELTTSGLLEQRPAAPQPAPSAQSRIEKPAPEPKPVNTGLSDRSGQPAEAQPASVPTADEIWNLPMEQARDRIVRTLHQARRGQISQ